MSLHGRYASRWTERRAGVSLTAPGAAVSATTASRIEMEALEPIDDAAGIELEAHSGHHSVQRPYSGHR